MHTQDAVISTPTKHHLDFVPAAFDTFPEALDYAARGDTGANFYNGRAKLYSVLPYRRLREEALKLARKLLGMGLEKGDRVALIAETNPHFLRFFCACQYAGLVPVALPASVKVGAHQAYVAQLQRLLAASEASIAIASDGYLEFLQEAAVRLNLRRVGEPESFYELPEPELTLPQIDADDVSYLQYTSGSTRFPRGVVIRHRSAMANLRGMIQDGLAINGNDRLMSWLPFYHDMGLVGFRAGADCRTALHRLPGHAGVRHAPAPVAAADDQHKGDDLLRAESFGYDLCARRVRSSDLETYDLSNWRVAGIGAEMIRPQTLERFAEVLEPCGFDRRAFVACYGMAECTLGVSFSPLNIGYTTHYIDSDHLSDRHEAVPMSSGRTSGRGRHFVNCGKPLPSFEVEIRDDDGRAVADWHSGVIHLRGPSVMSGYNKLPEETADALCEDGWLNTGDIGYLADGVLTITGRKKDLIIIHGRNIWPQDLEHLAETLPEVRVGDALAFSVPDHEGEEMCVLVVQCRERDPQRRNGLVRRLTAMVRLELSLDCYVELVPNNSLPRTSSGKLSRAKARLDFIESHESERYDAAIEAMKARVATA